MMEIIEERALVAIYINLLIQDSDDETSDSLSDSAQIVQSLERYLTRIPKVRIYNYVKDVVWHYSDKEFQSHFRLTRTTFEFVLQLLHPRLCRQNKGCGRETKEPEFTLLLAIWMMATPSSYRCVADRFGVGKGIAWRCVQKVVNALYCHLHKFITWPDRDRAEEIWTHMENKRRIPKVIGAVDGTHIRISAPARNSDSYINRKGYHSIQLQVVCDHELKFTHVYTGEVGSVHDMRVFRLSGLQDMCNEEHFPENSHLLTDAAYTIQKNVIVPFKQYRPLRDEQVYFNTCLSRARAMVERAIGLLKGRFRSLLDKLPMRRIDLIPKYICASCILHNICLMCNDRVRIPIIVERDAPNVDRHFVHVPRHLKRAGIDKRNEIMQNL